MLDRPPDRRLPSVRRAAASPSAIVAAGAGVAAGEASHLGLAAALGLGAVTYALRLTWAALARRRALRRRAMRREERISSWSVPEPWRAYVERAVAARDRMERLGDAPAPGPLADQLGYARQRLAVAAQEVWAQARTGAEVSAQAGRAAEVGRELAQVQAGIRAPATAPGGASPEWLAGREAVLAAELRELRRTEAVAARLATGLSELVMQMEAVVTRAAEVVAAGAATSDLDQLSTRLQALVQAMNEAQAAGPQQPGLPKGA